MGRLGSHGELYGRFLLDRDHNIAVALGSSDSANKPDVSFPLGTTLVVLIVVFITAVFSFCYHWHRLRGADAARVSLQQRRAERALQQIVSELVDSPKKQPPTKLEMVACLPVVYMPGDKLPKFIALPRPYVDFAASVSKPKETEDGNEKDMCAEAAMESKPSP